MKQTKPASSHDQSKIIQQLREELLQAQQSIEAIRNGSVDALVVKAQSGDKVFTLVGADHPYRILIEQMSEGAIVIGLDGVIVFANQRFAIMLETPLSRVLGSRIQQWLNIEGQSLLSDLLGNQTQTTFRHELGLVTATGNRLPVYFSVSKVKLHDQAQMMAYVLATDMLEQHTIDAMLEAKKLAQLNLHASQQLQDSLEQSINAIASAVETRDEYTAGHMKRVAQLSLAIATELNIGEDERHGIELAASIHDIGKIAIPVQILVKPGKLSDIEYMLIQTHVQSGYDILKNIKFPWPIADMVLQHHERMDGSGYPKGLKGDAILMGARIIAVSDVVEAMSKNRPYRFVLGLPKALVEIKAGRGTLFDAHVVDACLSLFEKNQFEFH